VMDMTGTQFCDSTGLRELVWAHKRAVTDGGGLHLVISAGSALARIFTVTGLDGLLPRFTTVAQALAQGPAATRPPGEDSAPESAHAPASSPANHQEHGGLLVADSRSCEQCGAAFVPRREHARFCSGECRGHADHWPGDHSHGIGAYEEDGGVRGKQAHWSR